MNLAINISNADESVFKAIKAFLKMRPELDFKIKKEKPKLTKFEKEILDSVKEVEDAYRNGTLRTFKSVEEMHEAIMNEK